MVDIRKEEEEKESTSPKVVKGKGNEIKDGTEDAKPEKGYYAIQTSDKEGDKGWVFLKKADGKIAKAGKKENAEEVLKKILDKRGDERARIVYAEDAKGQEAVIKRVEVEMTRDGRAAQRKNEIPKELVELYGEERGEQLSNMDEHERGAVLHLLQQIRAKNEELNSFGVLAAQRSGFRKDEQKLKGLEKLKGKIAKAATKLEEAKGEFDTATEAGKTFAEKQMKEYPHLYKWIMEQLGVTETVVVNGKTRRRTGVGAEGGKKALILKMFQEQEGLGKRLKPSDITKIMKTKDLEGVWEQYAIANPIKALKLDGYLAEDDQQRYYIP